jgi:hypothetical protein
MRLPLSISFILILAITASFFNTMDVYTTTLGLSMGGTELNPFLINNVYYKLSAIPFLFVITMAIWWWNDKRSKNWTQNDMKQSITAKKIMSYLWISITLFYLTVVVNNSVVLLGIMEIVRF